ncbi:hypothetical protein FPY71_01545 [Aureimonas fodinaquatilis]|uniref:Uncharacterized protein n=1 Tax=Aureimonas fodinaquatilis TaxID=2565783 RepID=A0A5B0E0M5_9HYPH|nr:hypothetical protein [Aureimonas fodinaquatilis]KAA0971842.1 hypothetical protein FPY71_01545 [Aureimonas fodinaquatilis]
MTLSRVLFAALLATSASPALAQSAVDDAVQTLSTFGDIDGIAGRWIWANMVAVIDLKAPDGDALKGKMAQFCPEDRSPVMAIEAVDDGFNIRLISSPPGLHWQYRRDRSGAYTQSVDPDVFYAALGYSKEKPPSEDVIATNERNSGRVTVIRPDENVLLITTRTGFDLFVRCDDK